MYPTSLVLYTSRKMIWTGVGVMLFFWILGVFLLFSPYWERHLSGYLQPPVIIGPKISVLTGIIAIVAALITTFLVWNMARYPEIIIDETGVHRPPSISIPWNQIQDVTCLAQEHKLHIILTADNILVGKTPVLTNPYTLSLFLTDEDFHKLCRYLEQMRAHLLSLPD